MIIAYSHVASSDHHKVVRYPTSICNKILRTSIVRRTVIVFKTNSSPLWYSMQDKNVKTSNGQRLKTKYQHFKRSKERNVKGQRSKTQNIYSKGQFSKGQRFRTQNINFKAKDQRLRTKYIGFKRSKVRQILTARVKGCNFRHFLLVMKALKCIPSVQ